MDKQPIVRNRSNEASINPDRARALPEVAQRLIHHFELVDLTGSEEFSQGLSDALDEVWRATAESSDSELQLQMDYRSFENNFADKINTIIENEITGGTINERLLQAIAVPPLTNDVIKNQRNRWTKEAISTYQAAQTLSDETEKAQAIEDANRRAIVASFYGHERLSLDEQAFSLKNELRNARLQQDEARIDAITNMVTTAYPGNHIKDLETTSDRVRAAIVGRIQDLKTGKGPLSTATRLTVTAAALITATLSTTAAASPAAAEAITRVDQTVKAPLGDIIDGQLITLTARQNDQTPDNTTSMQQPDVPVQVIDSQPDATAPTTVTSSDVIVIEGQQNSSDTTLTASPDAQLPTLLSQGEKAPDVVIDQPPATTDVTSGPVMTASPTPPPAIEVTPVVPIPSADIAPKPLPAPVAPPSQPTTPESPAVPAPASPEQKGAAVSDYVQAARDLANRTDLNPKGTPWKSTGLVTEYLLNHGFEPHQAIGVVANMMWESAGVNPTQGQIDGGGFGLVQYDGGRRDNLIKFAAAQNKPVTDLYVQLDFMMNELEAHPYLGLAELKATTNSHDATVVFEQMFEAAGVPALPQRLSYAELIRSHFNEAYTAIQHAKAPVEQPPAALLAGWPTTGDKAMQLFNQCDPRWGNILTPNGVRTCNIACGPTTVAMAVDLLKPDLRITPKETIEMANANKLWFPAKGVADAGGISFDSLISLAGNWGVKGEEMSASSLKNFDAYKQIIENGGTIVAAGQGPTPFVQKDAGAHFVLIRGITSDGKFLVADPYPKTPDTNTVAWDAQQMMSSIFGAVVLHN